MLASLGQSEACISLLPCEDHSVIIKKRRVTKLHATVGRVVDGKALRLRIFNAGVEPSIRKEAWKYLLGLYPAGSTAPHRACLARKRAREYDQIKAQWTSISDKQAAR